MQNVLYMHDKTRYLPCVSAGTTVLFGPPPALLYACTLISYAVPAAMLRKWWE